MKSFKKYSLILMVIFLLLITWDLYSLDSDLNQVKSLLFFVYTLVLGALLHYTINIKQYKVNIKILILSISSLIWAAVTSFLFNSIFYTVGFFSGVILALILSIIFLKNKVIVK